MFLQRFACSTLTLLAFAASAHAAPETLRQAAARNAALPAAPQIKEADFSRRSRLREVKLSPDGAAIAYLESDGKTSTLKLQDGAGKRDLLASLGRVDVHWSRNGEVLFIDAGDGLSVVRARDGDSAKIAAFDRAKREQMLAVDQ
ncbi:MAG: hypothetical protein ABWY27_15840, partial [Telluria sp.]